MGVYSKYIFPRLLDRAMSSEAKETVRQRLLADARGDVLEIGFGTGLNLRHYPKQISRLVAVDTNPGMHRRAVQRLQQCHFSVEHHQVAAEATGLESASFDTVVSTWTLCSVADVDQVLQEIARVARPDGKFLFVEHGLCPEPRVQRWQNWLNPINRLIGAGCNLNRDMPKLIQQSPLRIERLETYYIQGVPRIGAFTFEGSARPIVTGC